MITVDIETACTVDGCSGIGCDHALNPATSRITVTGMQFPNGQLAITRDLGELSKLLEGQQLCAFNFKFEHLHLNYHGVKVELSQWVADPMLMAYVSTTKISDEWLAQYEANRPTGHRKAGKHSLKTLAPYFLGVEPYWETADKDNDEYVLTDVRYTAQLHSLLRYHSMSAEEFNFYEDKLLPWTKMLVEAEQRGVVIDMAALGEMEQQLQARSVELHAKLDEQWAEGHEAYKSSLSHGLIEKYGAMAAKKGKMLADSCLHMKLLEKAYTKLPDGVDYDSPKQMLWLLRNQLGYDCTLFEGGEGTGKEVLQRLSVDHPDVANYLEWRKVNKLLTAFIPTYRELAFCEHAELDTEPSGIKYDGEDTYRVKNARYRINPIYNPANTRTGRTSSERPNMQQVPPELRKLFKAHTGYKFVGYDMGAIEAKLIAYYTEDPVLTGLIKTGVSLHDYNAKVFFGLDGDVSEIKSRYPDHRAAAKNVGFALFYNAGFNRIKVAFAQKGFHLTDSECKAIHRRFKEAYKVAINFANDVVAQFEQGAVIQNLLGRPLKIDNYEDCYMQGFNTLIQSSASDLLLHSANRASAEMREMGIEAHPILFVHDFVCFEVEEARAEEASEILYRSLTDYNLDGIPLTVDGGITTEWSK